MIKAAAFDSSTVRGKSWCHTFELYHSNNEFRADSLEANYAAAKAAGVELVRVGAWMQKTNPAWGVYDWSYLDRVAACARELPTVLVLYHYDWPAFLTGEQVLTDGIAETLMMDAGRKVAARYKGAFHSYVPMCETSFQAHMIDCGRWFPNAGGGKSTPEQVWGTISRALKSTALGLEGGDKNCRMGVSEPFVPGSFDHDARPFEVLAREGLLHIAGVNNYRYHDLQHSREEAARRWPASQIWLAETGPIWQREHEPKEAQPWYDEAARAGYQAAFLCPCLGMLCFDWGHMVGHDLLEQLRQGQAELLNR